MAGKSIFSNAAITFLPTKDGVTKGGTYCKLTVGGSSWNYVMLGSAAGRDVARIQMDLSLSGDLFVTGSKTSLGTYTLQFLDGPITDSNCSGSNKYSGVARAYFDKKDSLKESEAKVTLYSVKKSGRGYASTKAAELVGVITSAGFNLTEREQQIWSTVELQVMGVWR